MIIAIVPAPGHEGLTADGPLGEHPALLLRDLGEWRTVDRAAHAPHLYNDEDVALVLHAPGGPRLGMVRAMEALSDWSDVVAFPPSLPPWDAGYCHALAHLLHQRGLAAKVLVLPVTS